MSGAGITGHCTDHGGQADNLSRAGRRMIRGMEEHSQPRWAALVLVAGGVCERRQERGPSRLSMASRAHP